jgi:hypothetical protein
MSKTRSYSRPPFDEALKAWKAFLQERGFPSDFIWIFDENLCFEKDPATPAGFRLAFQTALTPVPPDSERSAYEYFSEFDAPLVFYRIGSCGGRSVCLLLCDAWFEKKQPKDGFWRRDDWLIAFHPGGLEALEEITDEQRWKNRTLRDRPLHDLDFSMTLRGIHEILAHGRVLTTYEHYALRLLHIWRRIFNPPH